MEFKKALSNLNSAGDSFGTAASSAYLGLALEASGDILEAESHFKDAKNRYHESGSSWLRDGHDRRSGTLPFPSK